MSKPYATIFFGIIFEEDFVFPWTEKYDHDVEEWWLREVRKFVPTNEIYDVDGNYLNGIQPSQKVFSAYYAEIEEAKKTHQMLVEVVNYGGDYCSNYAIIIPERTVTSSWGYPTSFDPSALQSTTEMTNRIRDFCDDFGIKMPTDPKWILVVSD